MLWNKEKFLASAGNQPQPFWLLPVAILIELF
jgi:hypothetical protein